MMLWSMSVSSHECVFDVLTIARCRLSDLSGNSNQIALEYRRDFFTASVLPKSNGYYAKFARLGHQFCKFPVKQAHERTILED